MQIETKAAGALGVDGGAVATPDPSEFEIICSVTGIVDEVNDVVEPGAYADTLRKRRPKIIKDHDWQQRLGKVLRIEEYMPGDARLPRVTAQGQPWPRAAGALVAKVKLFNSTAGQDAAERWREYGQEQQFSIGYVVPQGKSARSKDGIRHIKSLDLLEVSDVLWAAMPLCGPMPGSLATKMLPALATEEGKDLFENLDDDPEETERLDEDVETEIAGLADAEPEAKYDVSPVGTPGGRQNWVDDAGGLPAFIRAISHALIRHGASKDRAIATAIATVKRWAAGGGNVTAKTRAKAAAALAEWERMKTQAHATKSADGGEPLFPSELFGWDPAADVDAGAKADVPALETKGAPRLPGSFEERHDALRAAVHGAFGDAAATMLVATYDDHVVASQVKMSPDGQATVDTFRVGYKMLGALVDLDEPEPVRLTLQTADGDLAPEDVHLADIVDDATVAAKALLLPGVETKAGRVLSGGNADRIRSAVQALITVLRAAGVDISTAPPAAPAPTAPVAPSAPPVMQGKSAALDGLPDPTELVRSLREAARG